ncbi:sugar O-acetyltransferase [Bifidobacterium aquikefiricola]|uniref:Acetyltransferase n=1 Tax=Bifidobacterium aquikefiricola TaxID=3059038 RepID=A0AB39U542_9BIFI
MTTELEHMIAGELYNAADPQLSAMRERAHALCDAYNHSSETDVQLRSKIQSEVLPHMGARGYIAGPLYLDYGDFVTIGEDFYANFDLTILDVCPVTIGNKVMFGPHACIVTPIHPMRWQDRNIRKAADGSDFDYEHGAPITIGDNCWLASNVTVTGGVTIGEGCVIGAGSVVTHDIPANSFAAGVPCKVIRPITEADALPMPHRVPER